MSQERNKSRLISVSIMCSDLLNLGHDVDVLQQHGVDMLHVDVMDAHFVPNLTFGPDAITALQKHTTMPLDIHAMMDDPKKLLERIELRTVDLLSIHVELSEDIIRACADEVHARGAKFGLAINPDTPVEALVPYLGIIDEVIVMLVRPGFAKGKLIDGILDKVSVVNNLLIEQGYPEILISVDGSVSCERASLMADMGANIFVGGTAGIYRAGMELKDTIPAFRKAIDK